MPRPRLFRDLSLEDARTAARTHRKLLLVDVMGDWCQPCRVMDETTWRAPEVEAWVAENAVAVQVDSVDPSIESFAIKTIPTLMLFRGETLLDRVTGARGVEDLLVWLERAKQGEKEVRPLVDVEPGDIHGRRRRVEILQERGRVEEATEELAWIWEHALEVGAHWVGVRHSYVVDEIRELVLAHPSARKKFAEIRDRDEARLPDSAALRDWLDLNRALDDEARTFAWIDRIKGDPPHGIDISENLTLFDLLVRHARWADLGRLIRDPIYSVEREHGSFMKVGEYYASDQDSPIFAMMRTMFHTQIAAICHAIHAAGRETEAEAAAARARQLDPSAEMVAALESSDRPTQIMPRE